MRIVHHSTMVEHGSGMMRQVADLVRAERRRGLDSGVVCTSRMNMSGLDKSGANLVAYGVPLSSWTWAYEMDPGETVHVIHSHTPKNISVLENTVVVLHGTPEHVVFRQLWTAQKDYLPWTASVNLIHLCDMAVTLVPRHKQYWDAFCHKGDVVAVEGGVDVGEFRPAWMLSDEEEEEYRKRGIPSVFPFSADPAIFSCESAYEIKVPTVVLLAIGRIVKRLPEARLSIINLSGVEAFWRNFVEKSYLDLYCDMFLAEKMLNLETFYRGASVYASPVAFGDMSRCGMEALACGTPVVGVGSNHNFLGDWGVEHSPSGFADKIVEVYEGLQADEVGVRRRARKIAEEYYNIDDTVGELEAKVYRRLVA